MSRRRRRGASLVDIVCCVTFVLWTVATARNGTERQMEVLADTGTVVTWEYAQGCFRDEVGTLKKFTRGCWTVFLARSYVTSHKLVTPTQEPTDGE